MVRPKVAMLILLGVCAGIANAQLSATAAPAAAATPAAAAATTQEATTATSEIGLVEDTASDDTLDVASLWKKAKKQGKCIYGKKLVECSPGYGDHGYAAHTDSYKDGAAAKTKKQGGSKAKHDAATMKQTPAHDSNDDHGSKDEPEHTPHSHKHKGGSKDAKDAIESELYAAGSGSGKKQGGSKSSEHKKKHHGGRKHLKDSKHTKDKDEGEEGEEKHASGSSSGPSDAPKKHHHAGKSGKKGHDGEAHSSKPKSTKPPTTGNPPKPHESYKKRDGDDPDETDYDNNDGDDGYYPDVGDTKQPEKQGDLWDYAWGSDGSKPSKGTKHGAHHAAQL